MVDRNVRGEDKECRCIVRHAISKSERYEALESLERAQRLNDSIGLLVSMARLGKCNE